MMTCAGSTPGVHNFSLPVVVCYGYYGPSTKDETHQRREGVKVSVKVDVAGHNIMIYNGKKKQFLDNDINKQRYIDALCECMGKCDVEVVHAQADADHTIVMTVCDKAEYKPTVLIAEYTSSFILIESQRMYISLHRDALCQ